MTRVLYLTNIPAPYRQREFEELALIFDFLVLYTTREEANREWKLKLKSYSFRYVKYIKLSSESFLIPWSHVAEFLKFKPDVVVVGGLNFTSVTLCLLAWAFGKKTVYNTDAILITETSLSGVKKKLRQFFLPRMDSVIAKSNAGKDYFLYYKVPAARIFLSHYVPTDNFYDQTFLFDNFRKFDLIFSGQFIERKNPAFFCSLCEKLMSQRGSLNVLIIGSGPDKDFIVNELTHSGVEFEYPGFIQPSDLPSYYANSKILVFPTLADGWGLTANEACLMGTVVVISPHAGASNDLVISGQTGFVLELEVEKWAQTISELLDDEIVYQRIINQAREHAMSYSITRTVMGFVKAVNYALYA